MCKSLMVFHYLQGLELKGQMVYCPESDSVLFIGSPFLDGLEGLTGSGLFISDIPLHDATRDVILVGEQARAQVCITYINRDKPKFNTLADISGEQTSSSTVKFSVPVHRDCDGKIDASRNATRFFVIYEISSICMFHMCDTKFVAR